jgi:ATP-binding cassette subfamily B protein
MGEALGALARRAALTPYAADLANPPESVAVDDDRLAAWLEQAAERVSLEVEPFSLGYADAVAEISAAAPALLRVENKDGRAGYLPLAGVRGGRARLIGPDLRRYQVRIELVADLMCRVQDGPLRSEAARLLELAEVAPENRERAGRALLKQWLGGAPITGGWLLRLAPGAPLLAHARRAKLIRQAGGLLLANAILQVFGVLGWWLIGRGALAGTFDQAWMLAWALALLTTVPVQMINDWLQDTFTGDAGAIFKLRLLHGALQLDPEEVRDQGAGKFLERVMASEAVEMLALDGGFRAVLGLTQSISAITVLSLGVAGPVQGLIFAGWVVLTLLVGWRALRRHRRWADAHGVMTNDLVERMVGHRTRLAQEDPSRWHIEEDQALAHYLALTEDVHRSDALLKVGMARSWQIAGLAAVASALLVPGVEQAQIAVSLAGVLLGVQAITDLSYGGLSVIGLIVGWRQIQPIFAAAGRKAANPAADTVRLPHPGEVPTNGDAERPLLAGRELTFKYRTRAQPVLHGCRLDIRPGDRVLLEGPSGSGKSTLGAILAGLRHPDSGLLLLWGFDRQTVGSAEWRRRVVAAPQFHENHVLCETLSFNLLMGRRWPATPEDLAESEAVCRELGLGDLLDRMPSGMLQTVGESGWQLSHGERSRVYIARALLQRADLIVLDESFAALDPVNLRRALECVFRRAPALVVIAHP